MRLSLRSRDGPGGHVQAKTSALRRSDLLSEADHRSKGACVNSQLPTPKFQLLTQARVPGCLSFWKLGVGGWKFVQPSGLHAAAHGLYVGDPELADEGLDLAPQELERRDHEQQLLHFRRVVIGRDDLARHEGTALDLR